MAPRPPAPQCGLQSIPAPVAGRSNLRCRFPGARPRSGRSFYIGISAPEYGPSFPAKDRQLESVTPEAASWIPGSAGLPYHAPKWPRGYEANFRSGGGIAIAALAAASTLPTHGDFSNRQYLEAAEEAFGFLQKDNLKLHSVGSANNIIDDYSALLAATELFRATHNGAYRNAADAWAEDLMSKLTTSGSYRNYWRFGGGSNAPFFNATDDGAPVVALADYASIASPAREQAVRDAIRRSMEFQLRITDGVNNPFGYARELVRLGNGKIATRFFFPHGDAGSWWQGEDARLASLATAARAAAALFAGDAGFQAKLQQYAWDQLHWILGRNPYDACMLIGNGALSQRTNREMQTWQFANAPGAIINGITSGLNDGDTGIAFDLSQAQTGADNNWRWTEQWLPHDAWYLYAISLPHD